jgi:hypothetical protein
VVEKNNHSSMAIFFETEKMANLPQIEEVEKFVGLTFSTDYKQHFAET